MTTEQEIKERDLLVREAITWEKTPFHDCARLKGKGVDCANFIYEACHNVGLVEDYVIPNYTPQFLLHSERELFLEIVEHFCHRVTWRDAPRPGDLKMYHYGKCFSHGAIVLSWPKLIHARKTAGAVVRGDGQRDIDLLFQKSGKPRKSLLYTLKQWS